MSDHPFTHVDDEGEVQMVDVSGKPEVQRRATAAGQIALRPETVAAIQDATVAKGAVLPTARIAAIGAVKQTWSAIPLCHQIPITDIDVEIAPTAEGVTMTVTVGTRGPTGCEMEAIQGVLTGLATVWDMVKANEKDADGQYPETRISDVRVVDKQKQSPD
jgi:cyclic pyranopterin phosphate synthase